ncbi:MAG: MFS transporter [Rariglobus sp.]|nr:MFS transporter [Rariglobus sp.]
MSLSSAPAPTAAPSDPADSIRYKVGTLAYTKAGLITVFLFLLWGDFCFTLMEIVVPSILPLKFNAIGAPNWALGLVMATIPNIMTALINPVISVRSDRFRSKWGRRIPFLAGATPFLVFFLILLGYSTPIGRWVQTALLGGRFSEMTVMLVVIGVFMICFQFFNLFITSVYYYLFNDVVPAVFLARFMALFRVVGGCAGAGYNFFVLKYAKTHMQEIFLVAGLLYLVAFVMMCWKVREGDYPPPPPYTGAKTGFRAALQTYATECFSHRFYWFFFLANSCVAMTWASASYQLIYQTQYLGLDLSFIGQVAGTCGVVGILLLYPAGILADRTHPLRTLLLATGLQVVLGPLQIAFAMTKPLLSTQWVSWAFLGLSIITLPVATLYSAAEFPTMMKLFPNSRYGQFCSANALVRSLALIVGGVACGLFLDLVKRLNPAPEYCYRFLPVWNLTFQAAAFCFLLLLYREWKKLGGKHHFSPPLAAPETKTV